MKEVHISRRVAHAIAVAVGAFAVFVAYTNRMSAHFATPVEFDFHYRMMKSLAGIFGDKTLLHAALPTALAGALVLFFVCLTVSRRHPYTGVCSALLLAGCPAFFQAVRYGDSGIFVMAAATGIVCLLSFVVPRRLHHASIIAFGAVLVFSCAGRLHMVDSGHFEFFPLIVIGILGATAAAMVAAREKKPNWALLMMICGLALPIIRSDNLLYFLPLWAWSGGYLLTSIEYKRKWKPVRLTAIWVLRLTPFLFAAVFARVWLDLGKTFPGGTRGAMMPVFLFVSVCIGVLSIHRIKCSLRSPALALMVAMATMTLVVLVMEPRANEDYQMVEKHRRMLDERKANDTPELSGEAAAER